MTRLAQRPFSRARILLLLAAFSDVLLGSEPLHIAGRVVDAVGRPVVGARVAVAVVASDAASAVTDGHGRFELTVSSVPVVLVAEATGFLRAERRFEGPGALHPLLVLQSALFAETVSVTATRLPSRISDTAASVVVLPQEELRTSAAAPTDVVLRTVPGFTLFRRSDSRTANPTTQGVSLRGVGGSAASRATVLDDGIPLNDPFGGWIAWGRVPHAALERLEALRGPASDLYGGNALAGAILLVPHVFPSSGAWLESSYGSLGTRDASLAAAAVSGPWTARVAAESFSTDGFIVTAPQDRGPVDRPSTSRHDTLDAALFHGEEGGGRVFLRGSLFEEERGNGTPLQNNDTHLTQLAAGGDWPSESLGNVSVRVYGLWERYHQSFSAIAVDRASERLTDLQSLPSRAAGFHGQWSRVWGSHHLLAGVEGIEVRGESDETLFSAVESFSNGGGRQRTGSFFLEDTASFGARWVATAAVRWDVWRNFDASLVTGAAGSPGTRRELSDRSQEGFSPRAALLYRLSPAISLTASAGRSFRSPTLNELYRSFRVGNALTLANENLDAEHATNGELGAIWRGFSDRLLARGNLFWTEVEDTIANVTLSSTPSLITRQRQNLGRTRSRGVEVDAELSPLDNLSLSVGYLFADSTVRSAADPSLQGLRVPQVPRHQASLRLRARVGPAQLGIQSRFSDSQYEDDQNRLRLASFATVDLFSSVPVTRVLEAFVACENVFDSRSEVSRTPVLGLGPPRLFRAGLRLRVPRD